MAFSIDKVFTTRTALPKNVGFVEIEPISVLRPYVRCFWTFERSKHTAARTRIIPDCCADIIFDTTNNSANFVGACANSFLTENVTDLFGIRFYAWAVPIFVRLNAAELFDFCTDSENLFDNFADFKEEILTAKTIAQRVTLSQKYLIGLLGSDYDPEVMNCLYSVIDNNGCISVNDLSNSIAVSSRTLERKFAQNIGMSPKTAIELIRYQLLWQDCIKSKFNVSETVYKFGYYDQAHLYNDFKKFHGIGLSEARQEFFNLSRFYNTATI